MKEAVFTKDKYNANVAVIAEDHQGVQLRIYTGAHLYMARIYVPVGAIPGIFLTAEDFEALGSIAVRMRAEAGAKESAR